jgi:hypothetical protein
MSELLHREDIENISTAFESARVLEKNSPVPRPDKEILREVISTYAPQTQNTTAPVTSVKKGDDALSEEEKKIVQNLSEKALVTGVRQAVAEAEKTGRPEIVEAFHDWLVDHMYEKLVAAGLIDPS